MIIVIKARVKILSEEDLELSTRDLGQIDYKSESWEYAKIAIDANDIYRVIQYAPNRSIVVMLDGEQLLVAESFNKVVKKWEDNYEEDLIFDQNNGESETLSEDEDM